MKILIDMNLSPQWVSALAEGEHEAIHWSSVGDARAEDTVLFKWAHDNGYVVFTNDLDFGAILAASHANTPSVIQVRTQKVAPFQLKERLLRLLQTYENQLKQGALLIVDDARNRIRILPLT